MATVETFFIQPFKTHRKRLVPGQRVLAKTKHHALRDGERIGRTAEGLAVIHVSADDETGEVSALEVLARYGLIPEEFEEQKRPLSSKYDLTPEQYRTKWGLPADYPMVAPAYAEARSARAKSMGLGRKAAVVPAKAKRAARARG